MKFFAPFSRPEFRLAMRISLSVLFALLSVVFVVGIVALSVDSNRQQQYFEFREKALLDRPKAIDRLQDLSMEWEQIDERSSVKGFQEEGRSRMKGVPGGLQNLLVSYPNGRIVISGMLESVVNNSDFINILEQIPDRTIQKWKIDGEKYAFYSITLNGTKIVMYESDRLLSGPMVQILISSASAICIFSVFLFIISLRIASRVIAPIEERAERERSYARHIAHELKTPLAVIQSDLELAKALPEENNERIESSLEEIDSMRRTVDDLLLLSVGEQNISQEPVDISQIVEEVLSDSKNSSMRSRWSTEGGPLLTQADPSLTKTLIKNLVANANIHATPETPMVVRFLSNGMVFENSSGTIPSEVRKNPFQAFVGTPWKGSGIGLSIVKRIADVHGWKVEFKNIGSIVRITVSW